MKAALYCRVSTEEQTTENQKIRLIEFAERSEWDYELIEETMSTRKTRPKKQELMNRLRHKEFDVVVVWKLDRWARSMKELVFDIEEIYNKGVNFVSMTDNIDFSTASGRLQFHVLSAVAEFERSINSERVKEGLNRAVKNGKKLGRPKGSKDKKDRRKSGYHLRWATK